MNKKYQETLDEKCDFVFMETNPLVYLHVYSRTVLLDFYEYFQHWKTGAQRLLFDFKKMW